METKRKLDIGVKNSQTKKENCFVGKAKVRLRQEYFLLLNEDLPQRFYDQYWGLLVLWVEDPQKLHIQVMLRRVTKNNWQKWRGMILFWNLKKKGKDYILHLIEKTWRKTTEIRSFKREIITSRNKLKITEFR